MKKIIKLILSIMMMISLIPAVKAEESEVVYNGKDVIAKEGTSLKEVIEGLQPGKTVSFEVRITNDSDRQTDWYITNKVLNSLEDNSSARNGGYSYLLEYIAPSGKTTAIYDSENVGGESEKGGRGLHQAQLKDYFYLDTLEGKQSGMIRITVGLDGESQPNSYMDTMADLEVRFAVEVEDDILIPYTGDSSNLKMYELIFAGSLIIAVAAIGYLLYERRKEAAR